MPNTPQVRFNFENENVQASVPLLGVTNVLARTTRGPFNDPSDLLSTFTQFQARFGAEIVPDGTISNIERAFALGSKVRVSRVAGAGEVAFGFASSTTLPPSGDRTPLYLQIHFNPTPEEDATNIVIFSLLVKTKEAGSAVVDETGYGLNRDWFLVFSQGDGPTNRYSISQYLQYEETTVDEMVVKTVEGLMDSRTLIAGSYANSTTGHFVDAQSFADFINNVPNLELEFNAMSGSTTSIPNPSQVTNVEAVLGIFRSYPNGSVVSVEFNGEEITPEAPQYARINEGDNGGDSSQAQWIEAYEASKEYYEAYQIIASHIHQHIPTTWQATMATIAKDVTTWFEQLCFIEVPKYDTDGNPRDADAIVAVQKTLVPQVGQSKAVAYFAGGIKRFDVNGAIQDCDVLGDVVGLADRSASNQAPWYSFSGMNRGIVTDAQGPVCPNYGSPTKVDELQKLAEWYTNLFVIKDTRTQGKRTMLWHGFTANAIDSSDKFISISRLCLYIKKNLRPILESYIEEPNTFSTWDLIFYEGREIMEDLVTRNALTNYQWFGDQGIQSYDQMSINNEADVRAGKYKLKIRIFDIVPLQDITVDVIIAVDRSTGDISMDVQTV